MNQTLMISGLVANTNYNLILKTQTQDGAYTFNTQTVIVTSDGSGNLSYPLSNSMPGGVQIAWEIQDQVTAANIQNGTVELTGSGNLSLCCGLLPKVPNGAHPPFVLPTFLNINQISYDPSCINNALTAILVSIQNGVLSDPDLYTQAEVNAIIQQMTDAVNAEITASNNLTALQQQAIQASLATFCTNLAEIYSKLDGHI